MRYLFDRFELDEDRYELRRQGEAAPIEVQPKVMEVLLHLARHAERTLTKDELLDAVWGDVSITEASLTRCISLARRALDDHEGEARLIQTVRGRGYRMGVEVTAVGFGESTPTSPAAPETVSTPEAPEPVAVRPGSRRRLAAAAGLGLVALLLWLTRPFQPELVHASLPDSPDAYPRTAIAVLRFRDLRVPEGTSAEADGHALDLIEQLSASPELQVTASRSSFRFAADDAIDPPEVARTLGVGSLVLGAIQPGSPPTLAIELVDATTGFQHHTESIALAPDRETGPELTRAMSRTLGVELDHIDPFRAIAADPEAPSALLEGRSAFLAADRAELLAAVERYERALERDPDFLRGYVALGHAYRRLWELESEIEGGLGPWLEAADAVALEALERAPRDPGALALFASVRHSQKDWAAAEAALHIAYRERPNAYVSYQLGVLYLLMGHLETARPYILRALRLDPLNPDVLRGAGRMHFYAREYPEAIAMLRRTLDVRPRDHWAPRLLANTHLLAGDEDAAKESFLRVAPAWARPLARMLGRVVGSERSLRWIFEGAIAASGRRCRDDAQGTALMWGMLGERERMLECLEEAGRVFLWYARLEPALDPYRDDPEFQRVMAEAGFGPLPVPTGPDVESSAPVPAPGGG